MFTIAQVVCIFLALICCLVVLYIWLHGYRKDICFTNSDSTGQHGENWEIRLDKTLLIIAFVGKLLYDGGECVRAIV